MAITSDSNGPGTIGALTRRRFVLGGIGLGVVILAGCGEDVGETAGSTSTPDSTATPDPFPVIMEHKFGSTTIPSDPQRIVSVGFNDEDFVFALGKTVIGSLRPTDYEYHNRPWATQELAEADPESVGSSEELLFEQIAALNPDLIIGLYAGISEGDYDLLSRIAPSVLQPERYDDYAILWQDQLRVTGRALGRQERAKELVDQLEQRFAQAREEHPDFENSSAVLMALNPGNGYYAYTGPRGAFFTSLGLTIPDEIVERAGEKFFAEYSSEQVEVFDQDVVIMYATREEAEGDPLFKSLNAVRDGRVVYLPDSADLYGALNYNSPLSLPFQIDGFVPRLDQAIDGDPATQIEPIT